MKKFLVLAIFVSILSLPLMAQDKVEVFGGYQYLHLNNVGGCGSDCPTVNANGWDGSVTGYFNKWIGVTGDFGGAYESNVTINGVSTPISGKVYTYAGGPVLAFRKGPIHPFVHVLFGGVHLSASVSEDGESASQSQSGFATLVGGGADIKINRIMAVRGQFDWVYTHFGSSPINGNVAYGESGNVRVATGIVFRF